MDSASNSAHSNSKYQPISAPPWSIQRPLRELKAFERTMIRAGETKNISFILKPGQDLNYYNTESREYEVEKGTYKIFAGPSSYLTVIESVDLIVE